MGILRTLFAKRSRAARTERRTARRIRARLRPGKLLDAELGFIGDCAIVERSKHGLRLRLFDRVVERDDLVAVLDENEGSVRHGRIVWRRDGEAGIRVETEPERLDPAVLRRLSGPYYAVSD